MDKLSASYGNIILLGDFNVEPEEAKMTEFLNMYSLKNIVSQKTCFKNPENPSCIDLILTNCSRSFQNTDVFETGLSDFHKLTFTVFKQYYPKQKPKVVFYRKYKNFRNDLFRSELENELSKYDINNMEYDIFLGTFLKILDKYAPMKKKYLMATFMTKEVRKATMMRSKLRNKFLQDKHEKSRNDYRKQRNLCVGLFRRAKQQYFSSLDLNLIADNKKFWKTVKPLFSDKISHKDIDGKMITEDLPIAEIFNNYFSNISRGLCDRNVPTESSYVCSQNAVSTAINKFSNHHSILSINKSMEKIGRPSFAFEFVTLEETIKEVNKLSINKASQKLDIPVKIVKENKDLISYFVYNNFNNALSSLQYPNCLKYADVTPVFKKDDKSNKSNYRPISILPNLSKVYERIMQNQIYPYLNKIFQNISVAFGKGSARNTVCND